ncbi:hypothetical protein [Microbacterium sp. bgisy189]|uniref:hypothetical protein n=1 Tax=Microbacterium sp. bgisy189 TaxID=3413798 RepID=UPI003EBA946D
MCDTVKGRRYRVRYRENGVLVGWEVHVGTTKTHERRSVPYPERLAPLIDVACAGKAPDGLLFGNGHTHMKNEWDERGWFATASRRAQAIDPSIRRAHDP